MAENSIIKNDQNLGIEDSASETLATQGNVINSLKSFWVKLRTKLNLAVTRDTSKAIGSEYIPVYVNEDGEVKECNTEIIGITSVGNNSLTDNKIKLNATGTNPSIKITVKPVIGTMVCLSLPNYSSGNVAELRIQDGNNVSSLVYYTSGISVQVKDLAGQAAKYLLVYSKNGNNVGCWILLNKINTVNGSNANSSNPTGSGGKAGLMSADDKAKLDSIEWNAKSNFNFTDIFNVPDASYGDRGVVKLGTTGNITINTSNKVYPVQVDSSGHMGVSVPWQNDPNTHYITNVAVGNGGTSSVTNIDDPQVALFEKDGNNALSETIKSFQIKGGDNITVKSGSDNSVVISGKAGVPPYNAVNNAGQILAVTSDGNGMEWRDENSYPDLWTESGYNNNDEDTLYLVYGPGSSNAKANYYLAGDGSWQQAITRLYAGANKSTGVLSIVNSAITGTLNLKTASNGDVNFCIIGKNGNVYVSSSGALNVADKLPSPPNDGASIYVPYFPIGPNGGAYNTFYKPGVFKLSRSSNTITVTAL